jgi:hypothetical protein
MLPLVIVDGEKCILPSIWYITPDIFTLKMTRTSWRQITFSFNKPAPLGAKILRVLHWKCSSPSASLDRIRLTFPVYKLMYLI